VPPKVLLSSSRNRWAFVDRQERTSLDVLPMRFERVRDDAYDRIGEQVLSSDLHDAWRTSGAGGEDSQKSRSFVRTTTWCSVAHVRISPSGAVAVPMVDQWTASNPWRASRSIQLGTGSCPREASRPAKRTFDFLCSPGGVGQGFGNVLGFQVGILAENLVACAACGDEPDDSSDRDPHPADARLPAHYDGVTSDARQLRHVEDSGD
jgi:hypothetical protein